MTKVRDIDLDSIDPEIKDIVKEIKEKINKEEIRTILTRTGVTEKIEKVAESAGLSRTVFLAKNNKIQEYVDKINSNPEVMNHLNRIGKISGGIMQGMMYKNLIDDILSDNYKGVAINLGFIAGGPFLGKLAEVASARGAEFTLDGRLILGRALKTASPFIARATSAFIIYDLVNQVKELKAGNKDALVGVVGDGIYLGVDVAEVGIELAEFAGILEGVSSVTGPIGAAIGAIVFVGTDIYLAVRTVEKEDKIIHLTGWEKFKEGWRAFLHIPPEQYMKELIGEKEANNQLVKSGIELLKRNTDIQRYVFPTGKSVVGSCRTIEWQVELCDKGSPINGVCPMGTGLYKTYKYEECNTKIQLDLESSVDFGGKMDIYHSRASPDNPEEGELFCLPLNTEPICHSIKIFNTQWGDCQPSNAYYCNSAIGVSYTKDRTGNYTLIALGKGKDTAVGFKGSPNIFLVEDGEKYFWGGDEDDIFVLSGSEITGILDGGSGDNTIDFGGFRVGQRSLLIDPRLSIDGLEWINMNNILGREGRRDVINFAPNVKHIDGRGGKDENAQDLISIDDCTGCYDEVQVAVRPYTHVENRLSLGNFTYVVHQGRGESSINIMGRGKHSFLFNYTLQNIEAVSGSSWNVVFIFSLSSNLNDVSISRVLGSDISYTLSDGTEIRISNEGDLYALQNTDKQVDEIIKDYPAIANMLNMTIVVQSSNESIIIGHGKHEVLHDNPEFNSHLVGNGGENIYVIAPTQKKINIYDVDEESSIDTLNLRDVMKEAQNISLKVSQSGNDLLIKLEVGESLLKFPIRIKNGTLWYKKLHVVGDSMPMQINKHSDDAWNLSLAPLTFDDSIKIAVITAKDVGEGNKLIVRKRAGQYAFSRLRDDLIIITDPSLGESNACTILLSNFYKEPKMKTLFIDFEDIRISLQKKMRKIDEAVAFCPRVLQMNKEFSVNGSNLLSSYDCLKFNSDEILFLRLDNSLLLLSDKGKLLMSNYYSDVHEKWSLPVELNDNIITSEEFRKRANNPSSFRYYQMNNQQTLKIYHNQPENKHYVGLVDLKDKSILKYRVKIFNNDLVLSLKNGGIIKVENWVNSESSKIIFVFSDAIVSNEKCIVSTCNPEDIVKEFEKERVRLVNEKGKDINVIPDYVEKSGSVNVDNSIAWSTYPQEERNEESKQRYRRHHIRHEDHHRGHRNHRSPIQEVTSSAVKPSSWINVFTNTIVDAVKGVSRFIFSPFKPAIDMEHSQPSKAIIAQGIDTNGTLLLLDVFIRKITGQKYISNNIRSICEKEAQIYALPIAKGFEQALEGAAIESGIPVTNLKFNPVEVFLKVAGQIRSGKFSEISKTLYSSAKEACPEFEQTGEFLVHVKSHLEEFLAKKETVFLQQKQTADQPTSSVSRKVVAMEPSKKPDTFLSDTSVVKGIKHVLGL
ncbi:hypothetical protein [Wolbachia endosymbiont (group A) of Pogonocherus hispidulus]|uniref:hypothetical protein n=1 Tax=Wolbachia endosymbiont (group A) of Pogonocherus hispidulus TaxID=3066136 RepID=UPI0033429656